MKRILIPTDFSEDAYKAALLGSIIAKQASSELHFIHVVFTPTDWNKMTDVMKEKYPESSHRIEVAKQVI